MKPAGYRALSSLWPIIGIDFGETNMGLAIAYGPIAEPHKVIRPDQIEESIALLHQQEPIGCIVIGLSENRTAERTTAFAEQLFQKLLIPIYFHDETLSTQEVDLRLIKAGMKQSKRRQPTDHYVAAYLLQEFIDTYNHLASLPKADIC